MSKIVSLNKARKAKQRTEKRAQADQNAVKFGRTKAQRTAEDSQSEKARRKLDGHKLNEDERAE